MNIDVPFTWAARNGEMQMVAGGWKYPIYFTNVIKDHYLYTKTYKWPFASADFFVDRNDSQTLWNVQQFGVQNLLDPQLDEWIQMKTFERKPGVLKPPSDCKRT